MSWRTGSPASPRFFFLGITLCCVTIVSLAVAVAFAQESGPPRHFFRRLKARVGSNKERIPGSTKQNAKLPKVVRKMNVQRVFPEDGTIFAEIQGCRADLDFSTYAAHVTRGILRETSRHQVFLWRSELSGGVGIVVTIAAAGVRLKAFHPVPGKFPSSGGTA